MRYLLFIILTLPLLLSAQKPTVKPAEPEFVEDEVGTFRAGVIFGATGNHINGDGYGGFDYLGLSAGGKMLIVLHKNWQPGFEILYNMKGSSEDTEFLQFQYKYSLDYIQVPVLISYVDRRILFEAGTAYNRLVRSRAQLAGIPDESFPEGFRKTDISLMAGLTFFLNPKKNIAVGARYERSLMDNYKGNFFYPGVDPARLGRQINEQVNFRLFYMF